MTTLIPAERSLQWLLMTLGAALVPHALRFPWWFTAGLLLALLWRYRTGQQVERLPGSWLRFMMVSACIVSVVLHYGLDESSVDIFVALLVSGSVLRALEVRTTAQARNLCSLVLLVLASGFIYGQSIPMALHGVLVLLLVLLTWQSLLMQPAELPLKDRLRGAIGLLSMAAPMMLFLFLAVPRVGPLWALPSPGDVAVSGISDELTPGGITGLGLSDELAFRVGFDGRIPAASSLYWRGLALDEFDGERWQRSRDSRKAIDQTDLQDPPDMAAGARAVSYELIMEPSARRWVFALAMHRTGGNSLRTDESLVMYAERPIVHRERFRLTALVGEAGLPGLADGSDRKRSLRLPDESEPRARALVSGWQSAGMSDAEQVVQALQWFADRPFVYTLEPPVYGGENGIDAFLFDERAGFCGHYASAFAYLMRAAGIPARVIVGYQGGEVNPYEDYLLVHQYNAHAWVEVWLEEAGWMLIDPTATVAPERIELGAEVWLRGYGERYGLDTPVGARANPWLNALRLRLDGLEYAWNHRVLNFDSGAQRDLLESLTGQRSETTLRTVLSVGVIVVAGLSLLVVLLASRAASHGETGDILLRRFRRLLQTAAMRGSCAGPFDGPVYAGNTLAREWPSLAREIDQVTRELVFLCYGRAASQSARGIGDSLRGRRWRLAWRLRALQCKLLFSRRRTCS